MLINYRLYINMWHGSMNRNMILVLAMLVGAGMSFVSAEGIQTAPGGFPQVAMFVSSLVIATWAAIKGLRAGIWTALPATIVLAYVLGVAYLLFVF